MINITKIAKTGRYCLIWLLTRGHAQGDLMNFAVAIRSSVLMHHAAFGSNTSEDKDEQSDLKRSRSLDR